VTVAARNHHKLKIEAQNSGSSFWMIAGTCGTTCGHNQGDYDSVSIVALYLSVTLIQLSLKKFSNGVNIQQNCNFIVFL
jgi:hypothetical protein